MQTCWPPCGPLGRMCRMFWHKDNVDSRVGSVQLTVATAVRHKVSSRRGPKKCVEHIPPAWCRQELGTVCLLEMALIGCRCEVSRWRNTFLSHRTGRLQYCKWNLWRETIAMAIWHACMVTLKPHPVCLARMHSQYCVDVYPLMDHFEDQVFRTARVITFMNAHFAMLQSYLSVRLFLLCTCMTMSARELGAAVGVRLWVLPRSWICCSTASEITLDLLTRHVGLTAHDHSSAVAKVHSTYSHRRFLQIILQNLGISAGNLSCMQCLPGLRESLCVMDMRKHPQP